MHSLFFFRDFPTKKIARNAQSMWKHCCEATVVFALPVGVISSGFKDPITSRHTLEEAAPVETIGGNFMTKSTLDQRFKDVCRLCTCWTPAPPNA